STQVDFATSDRPFKAAPELCAIELVLSPVRRHLLGARYERKDDDDAPAAFRAVLISDSALQIPPADALDQLQTGVRGLARIEIQRKTRPIIPDFQLTALRIGSQDNVDVSRAVLQSVADQFIDQQSQGGA